MRLSENQLRLLCDIERMTHWGGYFARSHSTWRAIKRLQKRRLVKRADRCTAWNDQFWLVTDAGCVALSSPDRGSE